MTQAIAGGNINISDSDLPAMLNLSVSGVTDVKAISVIINRLEHIFVVRKNISTPEELKGKRIAVSRIGLGHRNPHGDTPVESRFRKGSFYSSIR